MSENMPPTGAGENRSAAPPPSPLISQPLPDGGAKPPTPSTAAFQLSGCFLVAALGVALVAGLLPIGTGGTHETYSCTVCGATRETGEGHTALLYGLWIPYRTDHIRPSAKSATCGHSWDLISAGGGSGCGGTLPGPLLAIAGVLFLASALWAVVAGVRRSTEPFG